MGRGKKSPHIVAPSKTSVERISVTIPPTIPISQQKPSFMIECCDRKDFCFNKCDNKQKLGFANKLHEMSQSTWNVILNSNRRGSGSERIPELDRKKPISAPKEAKIIGLRYYDKKRMVGYKDDNGMFHILWLDHNSKLYSHGR